MVLRQGNCTRRPELSLDPTKVQQFYGAPVALRTERTSVYLALSMHFGNLAGPLAQNWPSLLTVFERLPLPSELRLRRRKPRVIVRAPNSAENSLNNKAGDRRAHVPTLMGLGTRESMPTLHDESAPISTKRPRVCALHDLDADATEQLLLEAERLSLCFEWEKE